MKQGSVMTTKSTSTNEGKFTINRNTGAKLNPKTGEELPKPAPKIRPQQPQTSAPKSKPTQSLDSIWMNVMMIIGDTYPDGDPIDWIIPWCKKNGVSYDMVDKAAKHNGYEDIYDYRSSLDSLYEDMSTTYNNRLQTILENILGEDFANFKDILDKQHDEAPKVAKKPPIYMPLSNDQRWILRYRKPTSPTEKVKWQVLDRRSSTGSEEIIAQSGESNTEKDAIIDATEWVDNRGRHGTEVNTTTTADFNAAFGRAFAPEGDTFYATFDLYDKEKMQPCLILSYENHSDIKLQKSSLRLNNNQVLQSVPVSPKIMNAANIRMFGRYTLGNKEEIDDNTVIFPLIYDSMSDSKLDRKPLSVPGVTFAGSGR